MRSQLIWVLLGCSILFGCGSDEGSSRNASTSHVRPYSENPHYLAWDGTPVFLLGAAGYHSWTPISRPGTMDFAAQLDRLAEVIDTIGSRHVRGFVRALPYDPMNHMHDGPVPRVLQPWVRLEDGRYDLERFQPEWETRLREFLDHSLDRGIVVSLEVWDDWSVTRGPGGQYDPGDGAAWNAHPFNPRNNVNYTAGVLPESTAVCDAPFYRTIPSRKHIEPVLRLQKRYVDRLLDIASNYPHILINISNESRAHLAWSRFWAEYIRERVPEGMMIGEMPSTRRENDRGQCEAAFSPLTLATDTRYDFVDVAQAVSGHSFNDAPAQAIGGAGRMRTYREAMKLAGTTRPLVVSKDYTRTAPGGNVVLWGRFMGGAAAARFHRLGADHGTDVIRFQHDAVTRLGRFIATIPYWRMEPAPGRIRRLPDGMEANLLADPDRHVVVQLLGRVREGDLAVSIPSGTWRVTWRDPNVGTIIDEFDRTVKETTLTLSIPGKARHRILHLEHRGE